MVMPKLAAFAKAYLDQLSTPGSMSLRQWIDMAATLDVDGLEFYCLFADLVDEKKWPQVRTMVEDKGMAVPMMCCSPDFTDNDAAQRRRQVELEKKWIDMTAALGGTYCRVLSGQRRPDVSRNDGIRYAGECINACLPHAREQGVTLIIENHYKDGSWVYPEFAQKMDVFLELIDRIDAPNFGVNYDPSNAIVAGDDPLELLERVKHRVVTVHASDRYLTHGTLEDLQKEENVAGYASRLTHGEIGKGMNDFDAIFSTLAEAGFDGWISIEDGTDGFDQMERSAEFLRRKMRQYWPQTE